MKGISSAALAVIFIVAIAAVAIGVWGVTQLAMIRVPYVPLVVAIEYDGEFDDAFAPAKGWWSNDFTESIDCNITSNVLGGSDYSTCVYNSMVAWTSGNPVNINSTKKIFAEVIDINGPVEKIEIQLELQNTGTCKPTDDVTISDAKIYRYDDKIAQDAWIFDLTPYIEDLISVDATVTRPNDAAYFDDGKYVIWFEFSIKQFVPDCATGDDIFKLDIDLTTDGDTDAARILGQSA